MKHLREALRLAPDDEEAQRTFKRARKVCAHVCTCGHSLRAACHAIPCPPACVGRRPAMR